MARRTLDDILSDLGIDADASPKERARPETDQSSASEAPSSDGASTESGQTSDDAGKSERKRTSKRPSRDRLRLDEVDHKTHRVDKAESSFSPLPSMPANQHLFGEAARKSVDEDPAVKGKPKDSAGAPVGEAVSDIYNPDETDVADAPVALDGFLAKDGAISQEQLTAALQVLKQSPGRRLSELLIEQGADEVGVQQGVAEHAGLAFERVDLEKGLDGGFDGKMLQRLSNEFCKEHSVIPLRQDGARVVVGCTNPDDVQLLDEIRHRLGVGAIKVVVVTAFDVRGALELVGGDEEEQDVDLSEILSDVEEADVEVSESGSDTEVNLEQQAGESPVIRYVNYIIQTAVREGASDIHIEPAEKRVKVRFRIDGVLFEMMNPPASMGSPITSRLKIMANLDISERRLPQDGRIRCQVQGRKLDLRVSTLPSGYGEKTVMRILDTRSINVQLEDLGFSEETFTIWSNQVKSPHGIVLVTGPTGSGKTTTLYSSLRQLDKNKLNISTVEDPVEYHLDGVTQTQTHEKIGMSFGKALKALLRQDPDVIMLGEIRDHETAHTAVQAALTGHLVLSTLHTNDAPSSVTRLVNIGLEPFLVGAAVNAVLAQRLVRRLCKNCKEQGEPSEDMQEFLEMQGLPATELWEPKGCDKCRNTGYAGRVGIYELLVIDDQTRDIVARNPNVSEFRRLCIERGMVNLRADGMLKVREGLTSVAEIIRVTSAA
ncbi:MAG: ATPase, T2SS/T4P/T4SS family [Planctomycetota bacterium]